jgi:hypothetical protein
MPAEICIYLCRCISMLCPGIRKWQIRSLGTICSQKVRESVPMHNYCHSENQNWRKEPPRNLQFFHENNTINSFEFPEIPKSGGSFFFHFDWFGNFISINRTFKLQDQNISTRKEMKWNIRIIQKVTLSSPSLVSQLFRFVKFSFQLKMLDVLLSRNWPFSPTNLVTLQITLLKILITINLSIKWTIESFASSHLFWTNLNYKVFSIGLF